MNIGVSLVNCAGGGNVIAGGAQLDGAGEGAVYGQQTLLVQDQLGIGGACEGINGQGLIGFADIQGAAVLDLQILHLIELAACFDGDSGAIECDILIAIDHHGVCRMEIGKGQARFLSAEFVEEFFDVDVCCINVHSTRGFCLNSASVYLFKDFHTAFQTEAYGQSGLAFLRAGVNVFDFQWISDRTRNIQRGFWALIDRFVLVGAAEEGGAALIGFIIRHIFHRHGVAVQIDL